jgi:cell division protein FtsI (penicillin-binding protein 3)
MSAEAAQKATQILETVVGEKGTAKQAAIIGYKVAGKTGTAQKVDPRTKTYSRRAHMALFTGFVPAEDPRLAMLVIVDEPQGAYYGGVVAAPVFRQVGEWTLNHLRVNPQVRMAEAVPAQERRLEKEPVVKTAYELAEVEVGLLPDFRGQTMREVLKGGNSLGVKVVLEGTGLAVGQTPEPGSPLDRVDLVKVNFSPPS